MLNRIRRETLKSEPSTKHEVQSTEVDLSKLLQKPHIVLEQQTNIVQLINARAGAIDAEAECEASELFGIDVRGAQHIGMDHARSAQLDPA